MGGVGRAEWDEALTFPACHWYSVSHTCTKIAVSRLIIPLPFMGSLSLDPPGVMGVP